MSDLPLGWPTEPPVVEGGGFDSGGQSLQAAIETQQEFIAAMEAHLGSVTDPARRAWIEQRITAHQQTVQYLEEQLRNQPPGA